MVRIENDLKILTWINLIASIIFFLADDQKQTNFSRGEGLAPSVLTVVLAINIFQSIQIIKGEFKFLVLVAAINFLLFVLCLGFFIVALAADETYIYSPEVAFIFIYLFINTVLYRLGPNKR